MRFCTLGHKGTGGRREPGHGLGVALQRVPDPGRADLDCRACRSDGEESRGGNSGGGRHLDKPARKPSDVRYGGERDRAQTRHGPGEGAERAARAPAVAAERGQRGAQTVELVAVGVHPHADRLVPQCGETGAYVGGEAVQVGIDADVDPQRGFDAVEYAPQVGGEPGGIRNNADAYAVRFAASGAGHRITS
ncbi:hypothetical protein ACFV42_29620 [Streptomyces solisilvae]|uniref:hypothetical protein n=1 Tax=Streptomyces malaysiensis TaxID=92644 RepID=UPI0036CBD0E4